VYRAAAIVASDENRYNFRAHGNLPGLLDVRRELACRLIAKRCVSLAAFNRRDITLLVQLLPRNLEISKRRRDACEWQDHPIRRLAGIKSGDLPFAVIGRNARLNSPRLTL
jgi:hypothetical protein